MIKKSKALEIAEIYLTIHLTEKKIALEYPNGEMRCPVHLSLGQELFPAILGSLMRTEDLALSSHRSHAHYLAKRGCINSLIAEIYGKSSGCCRGRGGSMHLLDLDKNFLGSTAIVANSIPVAVGSAASLMINNPKSKALCFIFFGDGAVEEGVFSESLNIASLQNLPTVFVCENNAFSVYTHLSERQPTNRKIYNLAAGFGLRSELIDISNIEKCIQRVSELLDWARGSKRPLFIEVPSWRKVEHCGPQDDDHLGYRSKAEIDYWNNVNDVDKIMNFFHSSGISLEEFKELTKEIEKKVQVAFIEGVKDIAERSDTMEENIYA